MPLRPAATALLLLACLGGCVPDPRQYESTPVQVTTAKGTVTCQLYTRDIVSWDRAINRPNSMGVQEADDICLAEGKRWKESG